jgi:hypothetical protein
MGDENVYFPASDKNHQKCGSLILDLSLQVLNKKENNERQSNSSQ